MVNTFITCGNFPQAGIAFSHLAMIAITRFSMIHFAADMGKICLALTEHWNENDAMARGEAVYYFFAGHIQAPMQDSITRLEGALEYAIQAGDKVSTILDFGLVGSLKFFASDHLADLEAFCTYGCEEIPDWECDTRGGTLIVAVRQVAKALQGKVGKRFSSNLISLL